MRGPLPGPLRPSAEFPPGPGASLKTVVESEPTTKCAASVARLTPFIVQPERYVWHAFRGDNAMNEIRSDQNDDEVLQFEVTDIFLESSAGDGRDTTHAFTQCVCTAVYFCPGP